MTKGTKLFYILLTFAIIGFFMILIPFIILTIQSKEIMPNNNNKEKEKEIKEEKNLIMIFIDKYPNKLQYKEGEIFDDKGVILKAYYDDNTSPQIFDYKIDNTSPLTIYTNKISFLYKDKISSLYVEIINDDNIKIIPNPITRKYTVEPTKDVITRFEIEDSYITNWKTNNNYPQNNIIVRDDSSRKNFLSGLEKDMNYNSNLIFYININFDADIELSISYSQKEEYKNNIYNISSIYSLTLDEKENIEISKENELLLPRYDITKWQLIKYKEFSLTKGEHNITLEVIGNTEYGTPNIDFIDLKSEEAREKIEIPKNDFHTELQYQYIITSDATDIYKYASGGAELSKPKGNVLDFSDSIEDISDSYILEISERENFLKSNKIYNIKETKYIVKNLKLGQKIYYRAISSKNEDILLNANIYELTVNNIPPRNLDIPGVSNFRDIGGYKTTLIKNGYIKQGLFYRSARLDNIEEEGKKIIKDYLDIKIEIDLREKKYTLGPYVESVEYHPIPIESYEEYMFEKIDEEYYKIFTLISNADKQHIVLHCKSGADRTGIMSFALLTLLGVEYNDIVRDYLFTNFADRGYRSIKNSINLYWDKLNYFDGKDKAEKCKNWLMSKGLEENKLEHIREIFIDGYKENSFNNY